jgi:hypothetical protein|tara:strand:- start:969 stop:1262 length:294 start_codon:yes stop_codon:yes gene_type:complete
MTNIIEAITSINPNAKVSVRGNDVKEITWLENTKPIAEADILAKQKELQAEYDANKYQRDRAEAYPSIEDQLDKIYHSGVTGWKASIKAIKDKYPKE